MSLTEDQVFEALGLEKPTGGQEPEVAEPAAQEQSGQQEAQQPTQEGAQQGQEPGQKQTPEETPREDDSAGQEPPMGEEERRQNAARRRAQERQEAIDKALEDERARSAQEWDEFFKGAHLKNTMTGEPITTREEYRAWKEAFDGQKRQKALQKGELSQEIIDEMVAKSPTMKRAQEIVDREEESRRQAQEAQDKAAIDAELREIGKLDPSIKTVKDLMKMPTAQAFKEKVDRGYSFLDAFKLVNEDALAQKRAQMAQQQAMNSQRSKDHLSATGAGRGEGAIPVPKEEKELYRQLMPGLSDDEIQAHYNKTHKA